MATFRQHLLQWNNDYTALERAYYHATGAELVSDPYGSLAQGPQTITKSVSVLIGTYNSQGPLEKSLLSIEQSSFNKKFPHLLEVIVIDDGSTDGTRDMIKHCDIDLTIKYILQDNGGLTRAHNTGVAFAEHDIIIFSDSDIVHTQYALEELMKRHEVLSNVTLAGFRFEIDAADPRLSTANIRRNLHALLPEFWHDFRLNFPGWPDNICRETQHWKRYGYHKKLLMANGAGYDLPAMVVGAFFSIARADYLKMGGSDPRLVGWGCEDSIIGAKSIGLGNDIIPVYAAASAHISHTRRRSNEEAEFWANIQTATRILDEEFVVSNAQATPQDQSHVHDFFVQRSARPTGPQPQPCQPYQLGVHTADEYDARGHYYYALGRFQQAYECYAKALELAPEASWWHLTLGKTLRALQRYQPALEAMSQCIRYAPDNAWAHYELGLTYGALADYTQARQAMEKARHLDPSVFHFAWVLDTPSQAHKSRGNHHGAQGDHHLAIRDFELALIVDDANCWAHFDRGLSLRASGSLQEALQSLQRTDTLLHHEDGNRSWVHAALGRTYCELGDYNNAKLQLEVLTQ
jgi:tetratricopeptide (TPR) repeat protein